MMKPAYKLPTKPAPLVNPNAYNAATSTQPVYGKGKVPVVSKPSMMPSKGKALQLKITPAKGENDY